MLMFSFALRARISRPTHCILSELSPTVKRPDLISIVPSRRRSHAAGGALAGLPVSSVPGIGKNLRRPLEQIAKWILSVCETFDSN